MNENSVKTIETIAKSDPDVTTEQITAILAACKAQTVRRKLITAKQACETLAVSRPTLRRYTRAGHLSEIKLSVRKIRFDQTEVERLAFSGVEA